MYIACIEMFIYLEGICRDAGLNSCINCILGRYSKVTGLVSIRELLPRFRHLALK